MLLEQVEIGVVYVDNTGKILRVNSTAERMLRTSRADVVGKRVDMLPLRTPIYRVLSENCRDLPMEISIDGSMVSVRCSEIKNERGQSCELFQIRDITAETKEKRQREEFVAMMTHDLKSPLTVIMGYIQALLGEMGEKVDPSLHLFIREMNKSSSKMLTMIEDVLDAYRLEAGLLQIDRALCNVRAIIEGACQDGAREATVHGSTFTATIAPDLPNMELDGKQIGRVFANLIGNAVKFTPRRGSISVEAAVRDASLQVVVTDTGIGIPAEELPKVFNKYFRSSAAQGFKGTGLGLTISKAIVEAHGGTISVESGAGQGSRFTVVLPLTAPAHLH
ncbi:PAS domain-containing sensor histidine kinase [Geomonas sp. Red875]|uniref:histidine kinase n=2 Tax=Geomesophilobacter sediminis TaxID=2798584 RepID=A0A8J7LVA2_9BACT|nr:PAS domain-containing sensor histidine kinase [Geomesophilobacter sediminis]